MTTLHKIGIRTVLTLAGRPFPGPGARERAIREQLGISPARYYQLLNALLDNVEALAIDPITVNGLRRLRDRRRAARESGRPGNGEAPSSFAP
ncbi:DUF3263 domain-containing protein [Streptomyces megasporus]|uniref:DUF3263 domain-containing protein n=1 Tax=Streptomyces megasporus TaxID=44060 RepID=UPI00068E8C7F